MDVILSKIYQLRSNQGRARQSILTAVYDELDSILKSNAKTHPFTAIDKSVFACVDCYRGDRTFDSFINFNLIEGTQYLYRVDNIDKILGGRDNLNEIKPKAQRKYLSDPAKYFEELRDDQWHSMDEVLEKYNPWRKLSWWTHSDLASITTSHQMIESAHSCGLPNDWLNSNCFLLRLDIQAAIENESFDCYLPSIIDAYSSSIFVPKEVGSMGSAINLTNFKDGFSEFIVRNIPNVKCMEFKAIKLDNDYKKKYSYANETQDFYEKVLEFNSRKK